MCWRERMYNQGVNVWGGGGGGGGIFLIHPIAPTILQFCTSLQNEEEDTDQQEQLEDLQIQVILRIERLDVLPKTAPKDKRRLRMEI